MNIFKENINLIQEKFVPLQPFCARTSVREAFFINIMSHIINYNQTFFKLFYGN